jgi:hypothetical protein
MNKEKSCSMTAEKNNLAETALVSCPVNYWEIVILITAKASLNNLE